MRRRTPAENTPRVIFVAVALFGLVMAAVPEGERLLLAGFAIGFAVLTALVDRQVRGLVQSALSVLRRRDSAEGLRRHLP